MYLSNPKRQAMKLTFNKGFYTLNFGLYETHFLSASSLIAYLANIDLTIQKN